LHMHKQPTLDELVALYIGAIAKAQSAKYDTPIIATDLSLYLGKSRLWFDDSMFMWSKYVADQVRSENSRRPPSAAWFDTSRCAR